MERRGGTRRGYWGRRRRENDKAFEQIDQLFGFLNGLYKNTNRSKKLNTEAHASSRNKTMVSRPQKNQLHAQIKPEKTKQRVYSDAIDIHNFPIDYSLKDRIRFVSKYSMDWAKYTNYSRYSVPNETAGGHGKRTLYMGQTFEYKHE